jgi:hypothetical protein
VGWPSNSEPPWHKKCAEASKNYYEPYHYCCYYYYCTCIILVSLLYLYYTRIIIIIIIIIIINNILLSYLGSDCGLDTAFVFAAPAAAVRGAEQARGAHRRSRAPLVRATLPAPMPCTTVRQSGMSLIGTCVRTVPCTRISYVAYSLHVYDSQVCHL